MNIWYYVIAFIVSYVVSTMLAPSPPSAKPQALDGVPTAEAGRPIPVLFGTRIIETPNVVWWGDLQVDPIVKDGGKK